MVPASRTKAHRDYTDFGSWQRKPVETGRHSLGDSLLQVGVHGGKREGVPQPGGTDRRRNAGPPRSPGNPPPFGAPRWDAAPPIRPRGPRCAPSLETPPRPAARNGGTRGGRGKRGLRAGGRAQPGGGLAPGPKGLEKAEEPEIKLPASPGLSKKQESSQKASISALLTMPKPLTVWIIINCGKF